MVSRKVEVYHLTLQKSDIPAVDDFLSTLLKPSLEKGKVGKEKLRMFWISCDLLNRFPDECIDYLHHVADAEERAEMRRLHIEKNFEQLRSRITYYISRFDNEKNEKVCFSKGFAKFNSWYLVYVNDIWLDPQLNPNETIFFSTRLHKVYVLICCKTIAETLPNLSQ